MMTDGDDPDDMMTDGNNPDDMMADGANLAEPCNESNWQEYYKSDGKDMSDCNLRY